MSFAGSGGFGIGPYGLGPCGHGPWVTAPFTPTQTFGDETEWRVDVMRMDDLEEQRYLRARQPARRFAYDFPAIDSGGTAPVVAFYSDAGGPFARFKTVDHRTGLPFVARFAANVDHAQAAAIIHGIGGFELAVDRPLGYAEVVQTNSPRYYFRLGDMPFSGTAAMPTSFAILNAGTSSVEAYAAGLRPDVPVPDQYALAYTHHGLLAHDDDGAFVVGSTNTYAVTNCNAALFIGNMESFTCEAWVAASGNPGAVFARLVDWSTGLGGRSFGFLNTSGVPAFHLTTGNSLYIAAATTAFSSTQPYHLVGTRPASNCINLHVNGTMVSSLAIPAITVGSAGRLTIGGRFTVSFISCHTARWGVIDEVAIYTAALSPTEIMRHYLVGIGAW